MNVQTNNRTENHTGGAGALCWVSSLRQNQSPDCLSKASNTRLKKRNTGERRGSMQERFILIQRNKTLLVNGTEYSVSYNLFIVLIQSILHPVSETHFFLSLELPVVMSKSISIILHVCWWHHYIQQVQACHHYILASSYYIFPKCTWTYFRSLCVELICSLHGCHTWLYCNHINLKLSIPLSHKETRCSPCFCPPKRCISAYIHHI